MEKNYDDIIHLPHHVSKKHPQMSNLNRAAQFAPFAALSGHEEAIVETTRKTDEKIILADSKIEFLNQQLQLIIENLPCTIHLTYYRPDEKKNGGAYITEQVTVKKVDLLNQRILLDDQRSIKIEDIYEIQEDSFLLNVNQV